MTTTSNGCHGPCPKGVTGVGGKAEMVVMTETDVGIGAAGQAIGTVGRLARQEATGWLGLPLGLAGLLLCPMQDLLGALGLAAGIIG